MNSDIIFHITHNGKSGRTNSKGKFIEGLSPHFVSIDKILKWVDTQEDDLGEMVMYVVIYTTSQGNWEGLESKHLLKLGELGIQLCTTTLYDEDPQYYQTDSNPDQMKMIKDVLRNNLELETTGRQTITPKKFDKIAKEISEKLNRE